MGGVPGLFLAALHCLGAPSVQGALVRVQFLAPGLACDWVCSCPLGAAGARRAQQSGDRGHAGPRREPHGPGTWGAL